MTCVELRGDSNSVPELTRSKKDEDIVRWLRVPPGRFRVRVPAAPKENDPAKSETDIEYLGCFPVSVMVTAIGMLNADVTAFDFNEHRSGPAYVPRANGMFRNPNDSVAPAVTRTLRGTPGVRTVAPSWTVRARRTGICPSTMVGQSIVGRGIRAVAQVDRIDTAQRQQAILKCNPALARSRSIDRASLRCRLKSAPSHRLHRLGRILLP